MLVSLWPNWWEDWEYQWKCTFVGETRQIIVNPGFDEISVKRDIYSAWKEWAQLRDNAKFLPAVRNIGGDPTTGNLLAGDIYFLINGWTVVINHRVKVNGVLFNDDAEDAYIVNPGGGVISTVSNLVQTVQVSSTDSNAYPSSEDIATATENRLSPTLSLIDAPISTRASSTEVSDGFSTIVGLLSLIDNKLDLIDGQVTNIDVDLTQMLTIIETLRKFNFNRSKINPVDKSLTVYDDDDVTPIVVFDLLDTTQTPSTDEVAEKVPRQ